ncbi:MAG: nuclear transport factor 2 family protein [Alphaproteobacteria bacterium]
MSFASLLERFTAAVESGNGKRLGELFSKNGVYHDTFYGAFSGPAAIAEMLEDRFWRDATAFRWDMLDPVHDGARGYARWVFSYTSKLPEANGKRVVFEGMSKFELEGDRIRHYGEIFDIGIALSQTNFAPERVARIVARAAEATRTRHADSRHLID